MKLTTAKPAQDGLCESHKGDDVEKFKVIDTGKCETLYDLFMFLKKHAETDERGKDVGEATAVHIDNKYVHVELRQFADGTREYALKGV